MHSFFATLLVSGQPATEVEVEIMAPSMGEALHEIEVLQVGYQLGLGEAMSVSVLRIADRPTRGRVYTGLTYKGLKEALTR